MNHFEAGEERGKEKKEGKRKGRKRTEGTGWKKYPLEINV